jgi:hypothetical protein
MSVCKRNDRPMASLKRHGSHQTGWQTGALAFLLTRFSLHQARLTGTNPDCTTQANSITDPAIELALRR